MKKFILIFFLLVLCFVSFAQEGTKIIMQNDNGVYKVPCLVNGAKMKFIFDTGASTVSLSTTMATYLLENDYISVEDIIGSGNSIVADGTIVEHTIIKLRDIEIAGLHLYDVEAIVINAPNAPLLLGQSAIQKLGKIELDGNILIIKEFDNAVDSLYIENLFEKARNYYDMKLYDKASDAYCELYALEQLSPYGIYKYVLALSFCGKDKEAYDIINAITDYQMFVSDSVDIYKLAGGVCWDMDKYDEALAYYELSFNNFTRWKSRADVAAWMADIYYSKKDYVRSSTNYLMALFCMEKYYGLPEDYLWKDCKGELKKKDKSYRNDDIDYWIYRHALASERAGNWSTESCITQLRKLGKNGNRHAKKFLNDANISIWEDF